MFIPLGQRVQTYRNWAKRRGLQILGEHATEQQARAQIAKVAKARQSFFDGSKKIINREKRKQRLELKQARIPCQTQIEDENEYLPFFTPEELEAYAYLEEMETRANTIFAEELKRDWSYRQFIIFHEARMIRYRASIARWVLLRQVRERRDSEGEGWKQ